MLDNSTICALATPISTPAALAIIRISGFQAHQIVSKIFRSTSKAPLLPRRTYFGGIFDGERLIDQALVHTSAAPSSFTGEDTAEINCHGSPYITQEIMRLLIEAGASPALPGEFSKRAFLNGKMDLAQAEAIADLIASQSEAAHRLSIQQMRGGFSKEISHLRSSLVDFASLLELELDFGEEDVAYANRDQLRNLVEHVLHTVESLCKSFSLGNVLKNGVPVAIIGATNVGKSTLLNALLHDERAIVSDIHGTTRDTIEEEIALEGIRFRFIDTAGLRESKEEIEQLGIERSYQKIRSASLLLLVLDATRPELFQEQIHQVAAQIDIQAQQVIIIVNKYEIINKEEAFYNDNVIMCNANVINYITRIDNDLISKIIEIIPKKQTTFYAITRISAKHQLGIASLQTLLVSAIRTRFDAANLTSDSVLVTNLRHLHALQEAQKALSRVRDGLTTLLPTDLIVQDLRQALYDLGNITGDVTTEEILGNIFEKFCIGK